ncbi:hypothetical protein AR687_20475 [Flavobacteriaceae bacterium CRH]|nr:hypothetical protein AR687_20475 [Flavobacteriaceae bacterium CRH]
MSDFKIFGNPNPIVGKEEFYSVNNFSPTVLPFQNTTADNNHFEHPVQWEIYILENGRWRKTNENDKTGKKISYTFFQKSLDRKGIRILARRGDETARLDVKTQPAETPKIDSIELLDKSGKKPAAPLSYGQTLKARVNCLHMEKHKVYVTLWEDDAPKGGHNKANEKNIIQTLPAIVKNGKADVDFLLRPSFAKIAKKDGAEDKIHEYYVTTDFNQEKIASNNVDVNDLEVPVAPYKGKTTPQQPAKTAAPTQPAKPKTSPSSGATPPKGEITRVHITDTADRPITGLFKEKQLKVWIDSKELIGKEVRLRLYDHDNGSPNDILTDLKFPIKANIHAMVIALDTIPRSLGGNLFEEGAEQELFAEVEVFETKKSSINEIVKVDAKVFKQDQGEIVNMVMKVVQPSAEDKKKESCGEKYCIKKESPDSELIREINIRLAGFGGNVPTDKFTDRTEKMIKQFQRDYMKVPETGRVCGNVLTAIDDFSKKFDLSTRFWNQMKCDCKKKGQIVSSELRGINETNSCNGFGDHTGKLTYKALPHNEANHNYEYPGIHRSLLFGVKALQFYFSKQTVYTMDQVTSGYRCRFKNYTTTNHQGKAIDIQFSKNGVEIRGPVRQNLQKLKDIRDDFYIKYLGAQKKWPDKNLFSTEPIDLLYKPNGALRYDHTFSWLHVDVREFDNNYLEDKYFCKNSNSLNGKSIVQLAKELGYVDTCNCKAVFASNNSDASKNNSQTRVDPKTLKTSDKAKKFILDYEKFKPNLYNDDAKEHHCTIGYGHKVHSGPCNGSESEEFKRGITETRAMELFNFRLSEFEKSIQRDITVNLYQYEFDALVSLTFNSGVNFLNTGGKNKSETQIKKKINNEDYSGGADEFSDVTNGGLAGLVKRRKAEIEIFKNNNYDSTH